MSESDEGIVVPEEEVRRRRTELAGAAEDAEAEAEADQLVLLPLPLDTEDERQGGAADGSTAPAKRRGPGRPTGARNKQTEAWTEYLLAKYRSPLEGLANTFCRDVTDLASYLCCSRLEAFKVQVDAMKALAPYLHSKQPIAIQMDPQGVVQLVILAPGQKDQRSDDGTVTIGGEIVDPDDDHG